MEISSIVLAATPYDGSPIGLDGLASALSCYLGVDVVARREDVYKAVVVATVELQAQGKIEPLQDGWHFRRSPRLILSY